jgi:hypothetical protein
VSKINYPTITLTLSSFLAFIQVQALEDMVAEDPRKFQDFWCNIDDEHPEWDSKTLR